MPNPVRLEGDQVEIFSTLIEAYEAKHHPIPAPDPIAAILFMMEQKGLTRRDLEPAIGSRSRVSEILSRRPLTLPMVRALSSLLDIPTDVLVQPYERSPQHNAPKTRARRAEHEPLSCWPHAHLFPSLSHPHTAGTSPGTIRLHPVAARLRRR